MSHFRDREVLCWEFDWNECFVTRLEEVPNGSVVVKYEILWPRWAFAFWSHSVEPDRKRCFDVCFCLRFFFLVFFHKNVLELFLTFIAFAINI